MPLGFNWPASLDAFTNPTATSYTDDTGLYLDEVVARIHDLLELVEAKVGAGGGASGSLGTNQNPAAAGMVGRFPLAKLDGTTEWLVPHLYNSLRNGGMERWSLGTSLSIPASTTTLAGMGPDCWVLKTGAAQNCDVVRSAGLTASSQYSAYVGRSNGQTGTGLLVFEHAYTLEELTRFRGQKVSLSTVLRANTNWSPSGGLITVRVACGTGAAARRGGVAYTGETPLIVATPAVTGSNSPLSYVSSVVVPTNATQMSVSFEWTPSSTPSGPSDGVFVDDVMLVPGDVPMPFKTRVDDAYECTRHVEVFTYNGYQAIGPGQSVSDTQAHGFFFFALKRVQPTVILSAAADFAVAGGYFAGQACTSIAASQIGPTSTWLDASVATGLFNEGRAALFIANGTGVTKIIIQAGV